MCDEIEDSLSQHAQVWSGASSSGTMQIEFWDGGGRGGVCRAPSGSVSELKKVESRLHMLGCTDKDDEDVRDLFGLA